MTIQINIGDHASPHVGYLPFKDIHHVMMRWVRRKAIWIAKTKPSADVYFLGITTGARSLTALLADKAIWVNYHPTLTDYGVTPGASGFATEFAIGPAAIKIGRWMVLGTFIHELAHCNGAGGGTSTAAEDALPHCGLGTMKELSTKVDDPATPYNPGIAG